MDRLRRNKTHRSVTVGLSSVPFQWMLYAAKLLLSFTLILIEEMKKFSIIHEILDSLGYEYERGCHVGWCTM